MTDRQIMDFLNMLPLGEKGRPGTLRHLTFVVDENMYETTKDAVKGQVVAALSKYYCSEKRFEKLWNCLNNAERKIASLHIWGDGDEPVSCADEVAQEFGIKEKMERRYYYYSRNGLDSYKERYAEKRSRLWLLFPQIGFNQIFSKELEELIGEMEREYSQVSDKLVFTSRENRTADFANIVRYCNMGKLTVTKGGILSKSSALKLRDFCGYEDYAADIGASPKDMRTTEGLLVTFPLTVFCTIGGLIAAAEGECIPGGKSLSLIDLPYEQLIKKLFEAYLKSKSFNEISLMKGIKSKRGHNPSDARQNIVKELMYCPPGQPVYVNELERYLRLSAKNFARKEERYIVPIGNSYHDYGVEWKYYEHPLINIVLSFFGALGIMDIAWGEDSVLSASGKRRAPIAFKINSLGAYVLGLSGSYTAPAEPKTKNTGGFTVLPDYTIVITDSADRIKHEMYFEKLFTKVSSTDQATIYKLDFDTVVRITDGGVNIAELRRYLSASDKPMPENVARALDDWEKQASRIKLRQVTILECDDDALLEEVIRYKGMGEYIKEKVSAAVIVDGSSTSKIKKVIEKNKRFCKNVI